MWKKDWMCGTHPYHLYLTIIITDNYNVCPPPPWWRIFATSVVREVRRSGYVTFTLIVFLKAAIGSHLYTLSFFLILSYLYS